MNRKTFAATVSGLVLVLSAAAPVLAASDEAKASLKTGQIAAVEKQTQVNRLNGEIASTDQTAKTVTVKARRNGKEITVAALVDDHTGIRDGRTSKSLADLRVGERVRIYYERQDNRDLARNILVQPRGK
jgi:Cu/Ag efflux protein CusF